MARFDHLEIESAAREPREDRRPASAVDNAEQFQPARMADRSRRAGQYENALRYYSRAIDDDKAFVAGWVGQVEMLIALGEAPEAELWSRKALEIFPGNGDLLAARARSLCRLGDLRQAGGLSDSALAATGSSALRWIARGEWMLANRQPMAAYNFDKAEQTTPDWLVPLEIALIYQHYSCSGLGLTRARRASELAPEQAYTWYVRGCLEAALGMSRHAAASFERCLEMCPGHVDAENRLHELRAGGWSIRRFFRGLLEGR